MKKIFYLLLTLLFSIQLLSPVVLADDDDDEVKGVITSVSSDTISFITKYGEEMTVQLNNNIHLKKKVNGNIAPGMKIEVEYKNGAIKEIEIEHGKNEHRYSPINDNSWLTWKRTNEKNPSATLPFTGQTTIPVQVNNQLSKTLTVIPVNGQAFIQASDFSSLLDATVTYYDKIGVVEVVKQNKELLFKLQSNVAYENMTKTPIEEAPFVIDNELYLPINVLANGLGYSLTWNEQTKTMIVKG